MDGPVIDRFTDFCEAWTFLTSHNIFSDAMGTNRFWPDCFRYEIDFSSPDYVSVRGERWFLAHELSEKEQMKYPFGLRAPDEYLIFKASSVEAAVIKCATLVYRKHGDSIENTQAPKKEKQL
ncbi:MAG: hypothetical protein AAB897_01400 [Patescibacteria group bacterium]